MARLAHGSQNEGRQRVLDFITMYINDNSVPPTIREIQAGAKISSTSMVSYYLKDLEKANMLDRYKRRSRGVVINDPGRVVARDAMLFSSLRTLVKVAVPSRRGCPAISCAVVRSNIIEEPSPEPVAIDKTIGLGYHQIDYQLSIILTIPDYRN